MQFEEKKKTLRTIAQHEAATVKDGLVFGLSTYTPTPAIEKAVERFLGTRLPATGFYFRLQMQIYRLTMSPLRPGSDRPVAGIVDGCSKNTKRRIDNRYDDHPNFVPKAVRAEVLIFNYNPHKSLLKMN